MNYYRYRFPSSKDQLKMVEREWTVPPRISPHETLRHTHVNNLIPYVGYSGNMRPYFPNHQREFFPYNGKRFPRGSFRRPYPTYEWNIHSKNTPDCARHNGTNSKSSQLSPHHLQHRFNSQYTQNDNEECRMKDAYNEVHTEMNYANMRNTPQCDPQYPQNKMFTTFSSPLDNWNSKNISSDVPFDQTIQSHPPEFQKNVVSESFCNDFTHKPFSGREMAGIASPQKYSISGDPILLEAPTDVQPKVFNNFSTVENTTDGLNSPTSNVQIQYTDANQNISEDFAKALNASDENSVAVYFLENLYVPSESETSFAELPSNDQINALQNRSLDQTMSHVKFPEIKQDITNEILENFTSEFSSKIADCNFLENFDESSESNTDTTGILGTNNSKENTDSKNKEYSDKCDQGETCLKSSFLLSNKGDEQLSDKNNINEESTYVLDSESQIKKYDDKKESSECSTEISLENIPGEKTEEQKFIFHAPIININQQNQISAGNSMVSSKDSEQLLGTIKSSNFNHKLSQYFANVMKALFSLQNNAYLTHENEQNFGSSAKTISANSNSDDVELNRTDLIPTKENFSSKVASDQNSEFAINENGTLPCSSNDNICTNVLDQNVNNSQITSGEKLFTKKSDKHNVSISKSENECNFTYSKILDSEILSGHIETSLSSVTNYVLNEPTDSSFETFKKTFDINEYQYSSVSQETQQDNMKCPRKKKKRNKTDNNSNEMRLLTLGNVNLTPEVDASLTLLDNMFELDADESLLVSNNTRKGKYNSEVSKKKDKLGRRQNYKRHKITVSASERLSNDKKLNDESKIKKNKWNQLLKKACHDAVVQTSTTELETSKSVCKRDAQTQWDSSDMHFQKPTEKLNYKRKCFKTKQPQSPCNAVHNGSNVVTDKHRNEPRSKRKLSTRKLRTRRLAVSERKEAKVISTMDTSNGSVNLNTVPNKKILKGNRSLRLRNISTKTKTNKKSTVSSKNRNILNNFKLAEEKKMKVLKNINKPMNKPESRKAQIKGTSHHKKQGITRKLRSTSEQEKYSKTQKTKSHVLNHAKISKQPKKRDMPVVYSLRSMRKSKLP